MSTETFPAALSEESPRRRYIRFTLAEVEQFTNAGRVDPIDPWATYQNTHRAS